jgi:hypothetical protein
LFVVDLFLIGTISSFFDRILQNRVGMSDSEGNISQFEALFLQLPDTESSDINSAPWYVFFNAFDGAALRSMNSH